MNTQTKQPQIKQTTFNNLSINLKSKILNYLTHQQLTTVVSILQDHQEYQIITKIIKNRITFIGYLNRCDRSYYFGVYSLPLYQQYEQKNIQNIAINGYQQIICQFPNKFKKTIKQCSNYVNQQIRQQFQRQLQILFVDPCLPIPKLLRQTVAAKVCSPFQNFLIFRLENQHPYNTIYQPVFQQLQQKNQQNQEIYIDSLIRNHQKVNQLCYFAHLITQSNMYSKMIKVTLFGLTQLYLSTVQQCIKNIQNPFQILLELCARYGQFQSTVIAIQENLGFLFRFYSDLNNQIYEQANKFSYWKPAYAIWISKMYKYYQLTNQVYIQLISEQSQQYLNKILHNQQFSQISSHIKDTILHKNYNKSQIIQKQMLYTLIKQQGQLQILINSYLEHLVDISTNQVNILYCGHSKQKLDQPFIIMEQKIIESYNKIIEEFKCMQLNDSQISNINQLIKDIIINLAQYGKPRTIIQLHTQQLQEIIEIQQITIHDKQIQHYIQYIKRTHPKLSIQSQPISIYKLVFSQLKIANYININGNQQKLDGTFQIYHSDVESYQYKQKQIQISQIQQQSTKNFKINQELQQNYQILQI